MKKEGLLSSSPTKDNDDGAFHVTAHRRTNSFSSLAKAYRSSKNDKYKTSSSKLNKPGASDEEAQQLIAVLEHRVNEGERARREMAMEIATLKDQLERAEAQIALLKQANNNLQGQLFNKEKYKPKDVELTLRSSDNSGTDSSPWSDPLNTSIYLESMHEDSASEHDSDFNINTIINNINVSTYNNINNIQVNSINEINYIFDINNINAITNYTNTNNYHTVNNVSTNSNVNINNNYSDDYTPPATPSSTPNTSAANSPNMSMSREVSFTDKEKRNKMFRTTTHHKRRGSDTESTVKLEDKYQRRHSEGKVLRLAGLREQVRQAVLQILNTSYADSEDEWPAVQALLQGVELSSSDLPPAPRHLVHVGFVREGEQMHEGYWIDDVLLLLFRDFLLVAYQPKTDLAKSRYQYKEVVSLTAASRVHSWETEAEHYCIELSTEQCKRSYLINNKEECDKWVGVLTKHITAIKLYQGTLQHYLIAPCEGFVVEQTTIVPAGETKLSLEEPRKSIYHYQSFFYSKLHCNYVGGSASCPVTISIEDKSTRFALSPSILLRRNSESNTADADTITHRALVRTQTGDECVCIAIPSNLARSVQSAHSEILAQLPQALPTLSFPAMKIGTTLFRVKSNDLESDLLHYEANNMRRSHKIGVVYCAKGARTEAEMLHTTHANASADFQHFLSLLGQEVTLKNWADYSGGLDTRNDADGTHSIFTNFWGIPIMFHVSTLLPNDTHNPNVAKKRHIGNDIVVIIFKDHDDDSLFVPSTFKSHLNHIFCVVQHVNNANGSVSYKLSFCYKDGVESFTPALPSPPIFAKDAKFKHFLLAKVVNGERAAMRSTPFAKRHTLARYTFLKNLWRTYNVQPKEIDETCGQINTM